jgi:predicted nucleic acid-binding protein
MTGTIGILLKAKQKDYISELKPLLHELRRKKIWISESLMEKILQSANEK